MNGSLPTALGPSRLAPHRDPADRLPDEGSIEDDAADLFEDPRRWLSTEHASLGGKRPIDCIGTADDQAVRDLLRTMRHVGLT